MKELLMAALIMGFPLAICAENPSYERQRRGQVAYSDDQLFYREGSIAPSPASDTFRVQCEQNHFIVAVSSGTAQIGFSTLLAGPFKFITVNGGETLAIPLEVASGTWCRIKAATGAGINFRYIATGRTDLNLGTVK